MQDFIDFTKEYKKKIQAAERDQLFNSKVDKMQLKFTCMKTKSGLYAIFSGWGQMNYIRRGCL